MDFLKFLNHKFKSTTPTPTNVLVNRVNKPTIETVVAATTAANLGHTTNYMNTAMCSSSSPKKSPLDVTTGGMSAAAANASTIHNIARANSIQSSSNTSTTIPIQTSPALERKYHQQQQQQHHYYQGHHHHTHHHSPVPVLKSGGMACPPPQNLKSATAYSSAGPYIVASNNHINGDAYHDKISDAKFFSRNYRVKPNEQAMAANERQSLNMSVMDIYHQTGYYQQQQQYNHQTSPSLPQRKVYTSYGDREASKMSFYSQANTNYQTGGGVGLTATPASNTVAAATATVNNKLKLLKKRNALKKSLSNAAGALVGVEGDDGALDPSPIGGPVAYETTLINSTGREDYRSQNSLNKASVYLSRNSLNTAATNLDYYKSNDTLNNSHNYNGDEYTGKNLSRVKSTPHINQIQATGNIQHSAANIKLNQTQRTRSENEISNLSDSYRLKKTGPGSNGNLAKQAVHLTAKSKDHLATTTTTTTTNTEATTTPMTVRKEDEYQHHFKVYLGHAPNNNSASANSYQQTHNYSQHTISMSTRAAALHAMNSNSPLELFDASPYNIMSDPVICEQFRKLYEEDEYFQNVHKKCVEWLNKYVFADYDS